MLIQTFYVLLALTLLFLFWGYKFEHDWRLIGIFFMFLLGFSLITSDIQIITGHNTTETILGNVTSITQVANVQTVNTFYYGLFTGLTGAFAFFLYWMNIKERRAE